MRGDSIEGPPQSIRDVGRPVQEKGSSTMRTYIDQLDSLPIGWDAIQSMVMNSHVERSHRIRPVIVKN